MSWWIPLVTTGVQALVGGIAGKGAPRTGVGSRYQEARSRFDEAEERMIRAADTMDYGEFEPWQAMRGTLGALRGQAGDWQRSLGRRSSLSPEGYQAASSQIMSNLARKTGTMELGAREASSRSKLGAAQARGGMYARAGEMAGQRLGLESDLDMYRRQEDIARYNQRMSILGNIMKMGAGFAGQKYGDYLGSKRWKSILERMQAMGDQDWEKMATLFAGMGEGQGGGLSMMDFAQGWGNTAAMGLGW